MYSLYVDSSSSLVIGLLDTQLNWLEYKDQFDQKPSEVIHTELYQLIQKYQLDIKNINFIFNAGPGSYTGMRLSEGLAQILEWDEKKVFSFYHFDIPLLAGVKTGSWVTNAFKGEVFIYRWDRLENSKELVAASDFVVVDKSVVYTLEAEKDFADLISTKQMLKKDAKIIFKSVLDQKLRQGPYYFRTLEQEFK